MRRTFFILLLLFFLNSSSVSGEERNLFFDMIASGDIDGVKEAIAAGQDVNAPDDKRGTPLLYALKVQMNVVTVEGFSADIVVGGTSFQSGNPDAPSADCRMISALIEAGADVNAPDTYGAMSLHRAVSVGPEAVEILLKASADVDARDKISKHTPLFYATSLFRSIDPAKKLASTRLLLKAGADINARSDSGLTPLNFSGMLGFGYFPRAETELVRMLIAAGADVNAEDDEKGTPLLEWADASAGAVKLLLDAGADPNAANSSGETPLIRATAFGATSDSTEIVSLLLEAGAEVDARASDGTTSLWAAASRGQAENVALLLKAGADADVRAGGLTPLHAAAGIAALESEYNKGTFEERADRGAIYMTFPTERKPRVDFPAAVRLLAEAGADVDARSGRAEIAPYLATQNGRIHEAFMNKTPYDFARMLGNEEAARYLKSIGARSARTWYWPF